MWSSSNCKINAVIQRHTDRAPELMVLVAFTEHWMSREVVVCSSRIYPPSKVSFAAIKTQRFKTRRGSRRHPSAGNEDANSLSVYRILNPRLQRTRWRALISGRVLACAIAQCQRRRFERSRNGEGQPTLLCCNLVPIVYLTAAAKSATADTYPEPHASRIAVCNIGSVTVLAHINQHQRQKKNEETCIRKHVLVSSNVQV